jgi:hypothetical protein
MKRKLLPGRNRRIHEERERGLSAVRIAGIHRITRQCVYQVLARPKPPCAHEWRKTGRRIAADGVYTLQVCAICGEQGRMEEENR